MAKIVDDAIGCLPESIQRELNDAWASGKSSPYTRAVDPLNATLLHRAQTIRGMKMEIAALKTQRDELLAALMDLADAEADLDDGDPVLEACRKKAFAAIAKHKEVSHG